MGYLVLNISLIDFGKEPTDETYNAANAWADRVIYLHAKHTLE